MEKKASFSLLNVFLGLLICAFIFYLMMPPIGVSSKEALKVVCNNNLHQIDVGIVFYKSENSKFPPFDNWCDEVKRILEADNTLFQCPADKIGPCSYAMNENIPEDAGALPGDLVVLFESGPGWNAVGGADDVVTDRHKKAGANIAFADGRVEFVEAEAIPKLRWTVDDKSVERE